MTRSILMCDRCVMFVCRITQRINTPECTVRVSKTPTKQCDMILPCAICVRKHKRNQVPCEKASCAYQETQPIPTTTDGSSLDIHPPRADRQHPTEAVSKLLLYKFGMNVRVQPVNTFASSCCTPFILRTFCRWRALSHNKMDWYRTRLLPID